MTSRERITKILSFKRPDRIGVHDIFLDDVLERWRGTGLTSDYAEMEDYFGLDFKIFDIDSVIEGEIPENFKSDKFTVLSFSEPFQRLCENSGLEETLRRLARSPKDFKKDLMRETEGILASLKLVFDRGLSFDGAWAWGDLAYNKRTYFSVDDYKKHLFPSHKEIFRFLNSKNLFVIFHSDGNIADFIPHLLEAGVRAFHPLEEKSHIDIDGLLKMHRKEMVFMGHVDIERFTRNRESSRELRDRIEILKENSFYIYQADYPITPNISLDDYRFVLESIKRYGAY